MTRGRAMGPGRLFKRGTSYVLDYRDADGKRHHYSLGPDKRVAERRRAELIRRRDMELDGLGSLEGQQMRLDEVAQEYIADLAARSSPGHVKNVVARLTKTLDDLEPTRVCDLRPLHVLRLRSAATNAGLANRTANLIGETLKAMLNWAVDAGVIAQNPIARLKKLPEGKGHQVHRRRALSDDEVDRFLAASRADDERCEQEARRVGTTHVPQTPLWLLLLDTGARWGEARQLTWGDVSFADQLLVLRAETTKAKKERAIPLTDPLAQELRDLRVQHQQLLGRIPTVADRVLLSPRGSALSVATNNPMRIFDRVLERAQIDRTDGQGRHMVIHGLRHSFATRLERAGVPLTHAQRLMGHSDPKLTAQIYTHLGVDDLRGAIKRLGRPSEPEAARTATETSR
ncbi:site-specific integrase [Planctomycetes bacterium Pla163]